MLSNRKLANAHLVKLAHVLHMNISVGQLKN